MEHSYRYRPKWGKLVFWLLLSSACCATAWSAGWAVESKLVLADVIRLSRFQADMVFGLLALVSLTLAVMFALVTLLVVSGKHRIEIDDDGITLPIRPMAPTQRGFSWTSITSARLHKRRGDESLVIVDAIGPAMIARSHLGDGDFDEIVAIVGQHVPPERTGLPVARVHV